MKAFTTEYISKKEAVSGVSSLFLLTMKKLLRMQQQKHIFQKTSLKLLLSAKKV